MADLTHTQLPLADSAPSGGCGCGCSSAPAAAGAANDPAAVEKLPGVTAVNVDLVAGGVSTVTVTGSAASDAVRRALADAGYPVTD